jgi:hypothetical protein
VVILKLIVPTNFVPAVAVKRRERVLFVLIGCKMRVDGIFSFILKLFFEKKKNKIINTNILELFIKQQYLKCKGDILKYF